MRFFLFLIFLSGGVNGACQNDTAVNFWAAVTPESQPFDTSKLDKCLSLLRRLPGATLEQHKEVSFPSDQELQSAAHSIEHFRHWLDKAILYRRLGYKDCSDHILKGLILHYPAQQQTLQFDAYKELIYSRIYNLEFAVADSLCRSALRLAQDAGLNHAGLKWVSAYTAHRMHRTEEAREQLAESLILAQKEQDKSLELRNLSTMGIINRDVFFGHTLKAIPDHQKALALAIETRDTFFIVNELISLGLNYGDAAKIDIHLDYLYQALAYLQHFESYNHKLRIQNVLCELLARLERMEEVQQLREQVLEMAKTCKTGYVTDICIRLSSMYINNKEWKKAEALLDYTLKIYQESGRDKKEMHGIEQQYYFLYKASGDIPRALEHLEKAYASVSEEYVNRNAKLLSQFETQYRTGEKEKLLKTSQKQRSWLLLLAILITILCIIVFISYFRQRATARLVARQKEKLEWQQDELRQLEQLKSRFFANVSHELRTPLTLMLGPVDHLLKQDYWTAKDRNLLNITHQNGKRLLHLVNEILDLSKLETGKMETRELAVNWLQVLEPTVAQFTSFSESQMAELSFVYQADPLLNIYLDVNKFEKIIHNFLSNALKFTPSGGTVTLTAEDLGDRLQVCVRDTGQGIHPSDLPHIFDRFYQSRCSDLPVQGGTGIGLALCYELSELMGGSVWAESVYGKGSAFYFEFPKKNALEEVVEELPLNAITVLTPSAAEVPSILANSGLNKANVLVVEDNPDLRQYIKIILTDYRVQTAVNGKEAVELLQTLGPEAAPDLIISDIMMPVMDGVQFLEWVKQSDQFRHIPFVMLTARADARLKLQTLRIGVDDYMLKPFNADELLARMQNLLNHHFERLRLHELLVAGTPEDTIIETPVISEVHAQWLADLEKLLEKKLDDHAFNFNWVASELNVSERQFRRKVQQLTGMTPNKYLQEMRLQTALDLMAGGKYSTIKEVSFAVGYRDTPYFSSLFTERFGASPSNFMR